MLSNAQHGERDPEGFGGCQCWPDHGGCCSQVKQTWWLKKNKVFDINTGEGLALKSLDMTPNAFVCFQTEYRGWMSANPGGGGRAGEIGPFSLQYWQSSLIVLPG